MKKLVLILSLVFVAASCQKENIVPNAPMAQDRTLKSTAETDPNGNGNHGGPVLTISNPDGSTDPTTPGDDGGSITDPMKKKDKKDSK